MCIYIYIFIHIYIFVHICKYVSDTHSMSHPLVACYEEWLTAASRSVPLWDMDTIRQVPPSGDPP